MQGTECGGVGSYTRRVLRLPLGAKRGARDAATSRPPAASPPPSCHPPFPLLSLPALYCTALYCTVLQALRDDRVESLMEDAMYLHHHFFEHAANRCVGGRGCRWVWWWWLRAL